MTVCGTLPVSRRMVMRAFFICAAVVAFLIFPSYALSRGSYSLSTVCLDNNGQHEGGRFSVPDETPQQRYRRIHRKEINARARAKRAANPDAARRRDREWRENHPEAAKESSRKTDRKRRERRMREYEANREPRLATNQAWKDRSREHISTYNRSYYHSHKVEHQARIAVRRALKAGRLVKPSNCNRCPQQTDDLIGHHHSYARENWLDVEWLCKKCHMRHHAEEKHASH